MRCILQIQHIELFEPVISAPKVAVSTWFKVCLYNTENLNQQCTEIHNILDMHISAIDVSEESKTLAVALKHKVCDPYLLLYHSILIIINLNQ